MGGGTMRAVSERYSCADDEERERGLTSAAACIAKGEIVVLPTDTVYGIGADAFAPAAVRRLLRAKGRGRDMPPPVLVSAAGTLDALATDVSAETRSLVESFWPGPLTVVCRQQASLQWDLGDTRGTVAVRMPDHDVARSLLERTGPLAVSSANLTGRAPARTAVEAEKMLGDSVQVYLDDGPTRGGEPSTILDVTGDVPVVLRLGALTLERLHEVAPDVRDLDRT
jgi:L-threonylcarbamoyladenylate synthase